MFYPLSIKSPEPPRTRGLPDPVTVRRATAADGARIRVIARLDSQRVPEGPFLVAELSGEVIAAYSLTSGKLVADPFRPTADAVALLSLRAAQLPAGGSVVELPRRRGGEAPGALPAG